MSTSMTTSLILLAVLSRSGRDPQLKRLSSHLFKTVKVALEEDRCLQVCGFDDRECRRMPVCKLRPACEAAITAQSLTSAILQAMNDRYASGFRRLTERRRHGRLKVAWSLLTCQ